ncbi:putative disease resistance protein RGA3 [Acorus calamus]|uniref:Disease resistance protein RGA3 n=1 Tax=Acorus calamus TaxID=4465 RepID=A0AAV9DUC9_ACOCL|nr:putative disease resistance protein RGA3 [Acorus calamus]
MGVSALCMVGMGGIGKTTLVKLAYNDERVQNHFELKIWVNASECRDAFDLAREVRDSRIVDELGLIILATYLNNLKQRLRGTRYLLVIDGVFDESQIDWKNLGPFFMVGDKGSKIVITTSNECVSDVVGAACYRLEGLSNSDCWLLVKEIAFVGGEF